MAICPSSIHFSLKLIKNMSSHNSIVIGISSGIAVYKIPDLIKILQKKKIEVTVVMTKSATDMVPKKEFEKVTGKKVYTTLFPEQFDYKKILKKREVDHIRIADMASLFVLAPATANIIGKIAHGIADDFLTTTVLATTAPVLFCPSMNVHMWENPIVQENIHILEKRGYYFLHPDTGSLACGYTGVGRLAAVEKIAAEIFHFLSSQNKLKGKKIIVTAGGTSEPIDAVRIITNRSSGKMGIALAEECYKRGADVLLLRSTSSVDTCYPMKKEMYETGKDLEKLIKKNIHTYDTIIHNAAVSDYAPQKVYGKKLDSRKPLTLRLETTVKILSQVKKWNPQIKLIGFKAVYKETEKNLVEKGVEKLTESHADYIIVNDVGKEGVGFNSDENEVYIIGRKGLVQKIKKAQKADIAKKIIEICQI